eukprot:Skav219233  [mRNA]  locus=scaffold2965:256744:264686:- [translate_table: standard]
MMNEEAQKEKRKPFLSPLSGSSASGHLPGGVPFFGSAACTLGSSLGLLASEVVEQQSSWGPPPPPLTAQRRSNAADTAFAERLGRQQLFHDVALSQGFLVRLTLALERRAAHLGDLHGALLLAMLLSHWGAVVGWLEG